MYDFFSSTHLSAISLTTDVTNSASGGSTFALILGAVTTIVGGLITLAGIYINRGRKEHKESAVDDDPDALTGHPDEDYRRLLKDNTAKVLFLELRGYNTKKIRTGRETDEAVRES